MLKIPAVIDLFAGVGGFSLGAARADYDVLAAVELDPVAISSHAKNFPNAKHIRKDIRKFTGRQLLKAVSLSIGELAGMIGGPPCQGFSNMGHRDGRDSRSFLFEHFFRLVDETRPAFFVAENVPGILHSKFERKRLNATRRVGTNYELLEPLVVVASDYGVPTSRTRVFFVGYDRSRFNGDLTAEDFAPPNDVELVTVQTALAGLPVQVSEDWKTEDAEWRTVVKHHGSRFMAKIGGEVPNGVGDEFAKTAYASRDLSSGCQGTRHVRGVVERFATVKPGKSDPISRAPRLDPNGFCPTLRAGTGRDRGSFQAIRPIHFSEPRVITPREAARLQGFPDWFIFHPTKWHSFRQIGNSVSPIVAEHILRAIRTKLRF